LLPEKGQPAKPGLPATTPLVAYDGLTRFDVSSLSRAVQLMGQISSRPHTADDQISSSNPPLARNFPSTCQLRFKMDCTEQTV